GLDQQVANPFFGVIGSGVLAGATVPRQRLLRPYPQFTAVNIPSDTPGASSGYNALEAKVTKRLSAGLNPLSRFPLSKAIHHASETQGWELSENFRDFNNINIERSISGHDVPFSWVSSVVYELPIGKGKKIGGDLPGVVNAIVGGWQVSAISRISTGLPLQVTA